tara:strand:- start:38 stop:190 length:153 start_codon:yes stop_codon:yes gene_type:complete
LVANTIYKVKVQVDYIGAGSMSELGFRNPSGATKGVLVKDIGRRRWVTEK